MPREITHHKLNGLNDALKVQAVDERGQGNANHHYLICADESKVTLGDGVTVSETIMFQIGPIGEFGVNGTSIEAYLAVLIDRLEGFQSGQFACYENANALKSLQEGMMWLQKRTRDRLARGVEGTNQK